MHTRRAFLKHVSLLSAGFRPWAKRGTGHAARTALLDRLGVGLFTIPTMVEKDFAGTMKVLAAIGYKEIETFGPYSWSAQAAQDRWRVTSQSLAFKGSGYFGLAPAAVRRILDDHGLTSPSMHTDLDSLRTRPNRWAKRRGCWVSAMSCCRRFRRANVRAWMATGGWRIRSIRSARRPRSWECASNTTKRIRAEGRRRHRSVRVTDRSDRPRRGGFADGSLLGHRRGCRSEPTSSATRPLQIAPRQGHGEAGAVRRRWR